MTRPDLRHFALSACAIVAVACADMPAQTLGPADGRDLAAVDTGRVAVGDAAPDFTLASYARGTLKLSDYRGKKDVVLVFYRGHW
jgi:hypothetical protein